MRLSLHSETSKLLRKSMHSKIALKSSEYCSHTSVSSNCSHRTMKWIFCALLIVFATIDVTVNGQEIVEIFPHDGEPLPENTGTTLSLNNTSDDQLIRLELTWPSIFFIYCLHDINSTESFYREGDARLATTLIV